MIKFPTNQPSLREDSKKYKSKMLIFRPKLKLSKKIWSPKFNSNPFISNPKSLGKIANR